MRISKHASAIRTYAAAASCAALLAGAVGTVEPLAASNDVSISKNGFYLDTIISITLYGTEDESLLDGCFTLLGDYENMLSRTRENSDVWNINHSSGEPVEVTDETAELLETALYYCELSDGAFDIAIAPIISLWNFQPEEKSGTVPSDEEIQEALEHIDYHNVQLDGNTVTLTDPETTIDLGAIAKGYIADRLKDYLVSEGVERGLISLGGNILTIGEKIDGSPWNIGIRKPFSETGEILTAVKTKDMSVVTSGTYERYFEQDGKMYHHILDPDTGYPTDNGLTSVTILSEKSVDGDALSTTCFVLGPEKGMELIESLDGIEAYFVNEDYETSMSSGWPEE